MPRAASFSPCPSHLIKDMERLMLTNQRPTRAVRLYALRFMVYGELTALKPFYCKKVRREFEIRPLLGMFQPAGESGPPPADIFLVWAWSDCSKRLTGIRREIVEQSLLSEQICIDAAFRDVARACTERFRRWHATSHCSLLVEQIGYSIVASFCS